MGYTAQRRLDLGGGKWANPGDPVPEANVSPSMVAMGWVTGTPESTAPAPTEKPKGGKKKAEK